MLDGSGTIEMKCETPTDSELLTMPCRTLPSLSVSFLPASAIAKTVFVPESQSLTICVTSNLNSPKPVTVVVAAAEAG